MNITRLIDADLLKQNCKITGKFNNNFQDVDLITLEEIIDKQPTANEWISVKDDPPPDDVEVLFKAKTNGRKYVGRQHTHIYQNGDKYVKYYCITARGNKKTGLKPIEWMPLLD